ncbi:hypothetical protein FKW77_010356 [Venturia effusa]|uniref:Uncharacterized protein n=1 Tax=Venturia effusa TaxID=50376 RepID=A0A517L2C7_9PEZI|nr:hypothetical protein FKW77_010356 [Venturia effusa]
MHSHIFVVCASSKSVIYKHFQENANDPKNKIQWTGGISLSKAKGSVGGNQEGNCDDAITLIKNTAKAKAVVSAALADGTDSAACSKHWAIMAFDPTASSQEQLPLERFLAEGAVERAAIFGVDEAGTLSSRNGCMCKGVGPEIEILEYSDGRNKASDNAEQVLEFSVVKNLTEV